MAVIEDRARRHRYFAGGMQRVTSAHPLSTVPFYFRIWGSETPLPTSVAPDTRHRSPRPSQGRYSCRVPGHGVTVHGYHGSVNTTGRAYCTLAATPLSGKSVVIELGYADASSAIVRMGKINRMDSGSFINPCT